jgi:hypothetical protein
MERGRHSILVVSDGLDPITVISTKDFIYTCHLVLTIV